MGYPSNRSSACRAFSTGGLLVGVPDSAGAQAPAVARGQLPGARLPGDEVLVAHRGVGDGQLLLLRLNGYPRGATNHEISPSGLRVACDSRGARRTSWREGRDHTGAALIRQVLVYISSPTSELPNPP